MENLFTYRSHFDAAWAIRSCNQTPLWTQIQIHLYLHSPHCSYRYFAQINMHFSRFIRISFGSFALFTLRRAAFRVCLARRLGTGRGRGRAREKGRRGKKGREVQLVRQSLYLLSALGLLYFWLLLTLYSCQFKGHSRVKAQEVRRLSCRPSEINNWVRKSFLE